MKSRWQYSTRRKPDLTATNGIKFNIMFYVFLLQIIVTNFRVNKVRTYTRTVHCCICIHIGSLSQILNK